VTDSPSDSPQQEPAADAETAAAPSALEGFAAELAALVGSDSWTTANGTVRIEVDRDAWADAIAKARSRLPFFSWLSAVDWSREVAVGELAANADELEERFEVLCRLSSVTGADAAIVATALPKDDASIASLVDVAGGAEWHEREAAEMFGIEFRGHPNLTNLYLPDSFEGHPLLKSYPLLAREVKPWPGTVDVEDMPSTKNVEADAMQGESE
jgi:NADH-quinone oxidoreductase subunit C